MASPSEQFTPNAFSRTEVQDMLDDAQMDAGYLYTNIPFLRDQLQQLLWEAIEQCNSRDIDPMAVLYRTLFNERIVLDAYNRHRLGNAVTPFNARVIDPETAVEYIAADNIPEVLGWFPLRATVAKHDVDIQAAPIYQVGETTEADGGHAMEHSPSETPTLPEHTRHKTTTSEPTSTWTPTTCSTALNYNKLRDAPPAWLAFPTGNLTMAEVTAFLPQSIKSFDIINRFISNGALAMSLAGMINHYRAMPTGPIENNTIYRMMKGQMNMRAKSDPAYKDWTVTKHAAIKKACRLDPSRLSVAAFHTPGHPASSPQPPKTVLFRDLARGVKVMPSGPDALDLTRCIQYCVEHDDQDWHYPTDFAALVQALGGAAPVQPEHSDAAALARHSEAARLTKARRAPPPPPPRRRGRGRARAAEPKKAGVADESEKEDEESVARASPTRFSHDGDGNGDAGVEGDGDGDGDGGSIAVTTPTKRKHTASSSLPSAKRSRKPATRSSAREPVEPRSEDESGGDAYVGPKTRAKAATRSSGRTRRFRGSYCVD